MNGHKVAGGYVSSASGTYSSAFDMGKPQYDVGGVMETNTEKYRGVFYNFKEQASGSAPPSYQLSFNGSLVPQFKASAENTISWNRITIHHRYIIVQRSGHHLLPCR